MEHGVIYFVHAIDTDLFKIGYTTNPQKRFYALVGASPIPLRYVGDMPGDRRQERRLHTRFAKHRVHGEWFRRHEDLEKTIRQMKRMTEERLKLFQVIERRHSAPPPIPTPRQLVRRGLTIADV